MIHIGLFLKYRITYLDHVTFRKIFDNKYHLELFSFLELAIFHFENLRRSVFYDWFYDWSQGMKKIQMVTSSAELVIRSLKQAFYILVRVL